MKLKLEKERLNIFVITNKFIPMLNNDLYLPFQVGSENDLTSNILRDNRLDNIFSKNQNYSELTAAYWLWKNISDIEYIGLCHYRRYFNFYSPFFNLKYRQPTKNIKLADFLNLKINTVSIEKQKVKVMGYLKKNYIIIPKPINLGVTINEHYALCHPSIDFKNALVILETLYPEYIQCADKFFNTSRSMSIANMFISSKEFWNNYHEWLFNILFELEKITEIKSDPYQKRIFGFISERLFNLYLIYNKCKTKEFETFFVEN